MGFMVVDAMPDGAPIEACANLEPMHSDNRRTPGSPLAAIILSDFPGLMYIPGQNYTGECR